MFLLVPAHTGCAGQNPDCCKTVVCVMMMMFADRCWHIKIEGVYPAAVLSDVY